MPLARRVAIAATPLLALAAAPAAAQPPFEGVVTMRMTSEQTPEPMTMRYLIRQGKMRGEMRMAGMEAATIVDPARKEAYMVMPAQRMYMVLPLDAAGGGVGKDAVPEITRTGRTETVAGHRCEHFLVKSEGQTMDMCLATDMPAMVMAGGGSPAARASQAAWQRALGKQAGFPLKITMQGATAALLEVTSIERKTLDASLFAPPADFQRMSMPGGLPRRP